MGVAPVVLRKPGFGTLTGVDAIARLGQDVAGDVEEVPTPGRERLSGRLRMEFRAGAASSVTASCADYARGGGAASSLTSVFGTSGPSGVWVPQGRNFVRTIFSHRVVGSWREDFDIGA